MQRKQKRLVEGEEEDRNNDGWTVLRWRDSVKMEGQC